MKKLLLFSILLFVSCEEVLDADLSSTTPGQAIEASINWIKGASVNIQTIKLLTPTGCYESEILKFTGAKVYVTDSSKNVFKFIEKTNLISNTRRFTCNNFFPAIGETYALTIIYNGQTYKASEKVLVEPSIIQIKQKNGVDFNFDKIKVNCKSIPNQRSYYLIHPEIKVNTFPKYYMHKYQFSQETTISTLYWNEDMVHDNQVKITIQKNFLNVLKLNEFTF